MNCHLLLKDEAWFHDCVLWSHPPNLSLHDQISCLLTKFSILCCESKLKATILVVEYLNCLLNLIPRLLPKLEHHLLKQRRWDNIKTKRPLRIFSLSSKSSNTYRWQWYQLGMVQSGLANWRERWINSFKAFFSLIQYSSDVENTHFKGSWNHGKPARNCEAADWGRHYKKNSIGALNFAKMEHRASSIRYHFNFWELTFSILRNVVFRLRIFYILVAIIVSRRYFYHI